MPLIPKQQPPYYTEKATTKIYNALISQSGTSAPTVIELQNTIGNIVWTRLAAGNYQGELIATFPLLKTVLTTGRNTDDALIALANAEAGEPSDSLLLITTNLAGAGADDKLYYLPIQIIIYP